MSAIPFKRWGPQASPVYAGDNFRMAVAQSAATRNRPPAKPSGAAYFPSPSSRNPSKVGRAFYTSEADYLGTSPDPYPEREF